MTALTDPHPSRARSKLYEESSQYGPQVISYSTKLTFMSTGPQLQGRCITFNTSFFQYHRASTVPPSDGPEGRFCLPYCAKSPLMRINPSNADCGPKPSRCLDISRETNMYVDIMQRAMLRNELYLVPVRA